MNMTTQIEREIFDEKIYERIFPIPKDGVVVDIGAHVGIFTRSALDRAKKIYSIEPDPLFYKELEKLGNEQVITTQGAIGSYTGETVITSDGNANSIGKGDIKVPVFRFIDFIKNNKIEKIDFLKVDCEGSEYDIFLDREVMEWLTKNCGRIACELHIHTDQHRRNLCYMLGALDSRHSPFKFTITDIKGTKLSYEHVVGKLDYYTELMLYIENEAVVKASEKRKVLYITQHLSTGGMPQYLLKQIEAFKDDFEIGVCEVNFYGKEFTVQRDKIKKLVPIYELFGDQSKLLETIFRFAPDIIHFQELPETFIAADLLKRIYESNDYAIVVTSHSSLTRKKDFVFVPDRIVAVNNWQKQLFEKEFPDISVDMWEYPIEDKKITLLQRGNARGVLWWDKMHEYVDKKHILNVGLFTPGKNQGELFEIARQNPQNIYHFVGNQAPNFKYYWEPLMKDKPKNCIIWGERDDVEFFYQACDEFYFTSNFELNPLVIKEALSYGMPIKMKRLETYGTDYDNNPLITFV